MRKSKRKLKGFKKFLAIYSSLLVVLILIVLVMLHGLLKDYEEGRPASAMDKIVKQFSDDKIDSLIQQDTVDLSEFETGGVVTDRIRSEMEGKTLTYKKKSGEYSEQTPVYVIYAEDTPVAKITLDENGKNAHKFTKWKLGNVSFDSFMDSEDQLKITVPKGSKLKLNDIDVSDNYISGKDISFAPCKNVGKYVKEPKMTEYTISGLIAEPDISVQLDGKDLTVMKDKNEYKASYPMDDELLKQQESYIMNVAQTYGKYIINRESMTNLSKYMIGSAKDYVSDVTALWAFLYGKTYTYEFQNQSVSNLVKYSDNCFSCDIYYDLYVDWSTGNKTYNTSLNYTFVKKDGNWCVADFTIK